MNVDLTAMLLKASVELAELRKQNALLVTDVKLLREQLRLMKLRVLRQQNRSGVQEYDA